MTVGNVTERGAKRRQTDSVVAMLIGVALNVAAGLLVARVLGPSVRGTMVAMTLLATAANVVLGWGLPAANCFNVSKDRDTAGSAGLFSLGWSILMPLAGWTLLSRTPLGALLGGAIGLTGAAAAGAVLWAILLLAYQQLTGIIQGLGEYGLIRIGRTVQGVGILGGSIVMALLGRSDALSFFVVWSLSYGAGAAYYVLVVASRSRVVVPSLEQVRSTMAYGLRATWTQAWELVNFRGDQFYVAALAPSSVLGVYSVGVGISELLMHVPTALSQVVFSNTAAGEQGSRERTLQSAARVFGVAATAGAIIAIATWAVVPLLIGEGYRAVPVVFAILALPTALLAMGRMLGAFEMGVGRPGVPGTAAAVSLVITLALDAVLVRPFGAVGAATACGLGYLAAAAYLMTVFSHGQSLHPFAELWSGIVRMPATVSRVLEMVRG